MAIQSRATTADAVQLFVPVSGGLEPVDDANPLQVAQAQPAPAGILRASYSGTVAAGQAARLHGGAAGTPTLTGVASYRWIQVALQHSVGTASTGNKIRVRRRLYNEQGVPYTEWTPWVEYLFDSGTTPATGIFIVQDCYSSNTGLLAADELEIELVATTSAITWQAVVLGLRQVG